MKRILKSVLIFTFLLSATAYAAEFDITRNFDESMFLVNGTAEPDSVVTVDVYAPGKNVEDLMNTENIPFDIVKYHNELHADSDGNVEFNIKLADDSGVYTAYITADGEFFELDMEFINKEKNMEILDEFNNTADIEGFIAQDNNRSDLGFFFGLYDDVDKQKVAELIKENLPAKSAEDAVDIFEEAVIVRALTEGDISGIAEYKERLAILETDKFKNRYFAQVEGVDERLEGRKFDSIEEFEEALAEAVVLETIKNPNGYKNVQNVMQEFQNEIDISNLTNKESVYKKLSGNSYESYAEMKKAYKDYLAETKNQGGSSGGSGGGSAGGSSGSIIKNESKDITTGNGVVFMPEIEVTPLEKKYFTDMENAKWAEEAVNYLAEKKIVSGKKEGEFCPSDTIKREEFVTMIVNAFGFKKVVDTNEFEDVTKDVWFYDSVMAASQHSIISGVSKNRFGSGALITRQDMSVILYRVAKSKEINIKEVNEAIDFSDNSQIADYAKDAVKSLQTGGIISGMSDGSFAPVNSATRAQAAVMIYNLLTAQE